MPKFRHQPLDRPGEQIRLLGFEYWDGGTELRLSVAAYDMQGAPIYDALSYEWGDEEPTVEIFVNGCCLHIRHNLFLLLVELSRKRAQGLQGHVLLWADALCIDQSHPEERNAQVAMMGDIYRNAMTVFAWLGRHQILTQS